MSSLSPVVCFPPANNPVPAPGRLSGVMCLGPALEGIQSGREVLAAYWMGASSPREKSIPHPDLDNLAKCMRQYFWWRITIATPLTVCCLTIEVKFQADLACWMYSEGRGVCGEDNHCSRMIFMLLCLLHVLDILKASKIEAVEYLPG